MSTHYVIRYCHILPTPTRWNPDCLSRAIRFPAMRAHCDTHGSRWLTRHYAKDTTTYHSNMLAYQKFMIQCCKLTKSAPPGLAPPKILFVTAATKYMLIYRRTWSGDGSRYMLWLSDVGAIASGWLNWSTLINVSLIFKQRLFVWYNAPYTYQWSTRRQFWAYHIGLNSWKYSSAAPQNTSSGRRRDTAHMCRMYHSP